MREAAHAVIDAGADIVMGHGPHTPLPIEFYQNVPSFTAWAVLFSTMAIVARRTEIGSA